MLNFENIPVRLLHLSIGKEFRGEDEVTAADLKVEVEMHNNSLDTLSDTLRPSADRPPPKAKKPAPAGGKKSAPPPEAKKAHPRRGI
jgi:hypothetical protein